MTALAITRAGQGFPLVLVHGFLAGARIWQEQIEFFNDRFDVLAFNLPGFGDSGQLKAPETIVGFAEIILNQLSSIGIGKFHLMGHSMGGMIVQAMAAIAPDRVSKLVCYGTGPVGVMPNRFETIEQSRQRFQNDGIEVTAKQIAATWFIEGERAEKYPLCVELGLQASMQACLASLSAWETWDGRAELANIRAETLIVWGDKDKSYGWSQPEALWQGIENSALAVVPNCAHNVHLEKGEFFNTIVGDFLNSTDDRM